ncbi:MAG: tripartite tricarboxylate transporter substrate binding protein [Pseudomonadota bacterium]
MRKFRFRHVILLLWIISAVVLVTGTTMAQEKKFPTRPIEIVVPLPPGGAADLQARPLATAMEQILKQPVIVVNKPGGSAIGAQFVLGRRVDGYTALIAMPSFFSSPLVDDHFKRPKKYKVEQFTLVARLTADPLVLVTHPQKPWKSVAELMADAKRRPGKITYGSSGVYSGLHLPMEIFCTKEKIELKHVPYVGAGKAVVGLMGGHVDILLAGPSVVLSHIKGGSLRALGVLGKKRFAVLQDIPTLNESGFPFEYYNPVGIVVVKATPPGVLQILRNAVRQAVRDPNFENAITKLGSAVDYLDADEYLAIWKEEAKVLAEVIKRIDIIK